MILVDTNVLLHVVNADSPVHARAKAYMEGLRAGPGCCTTWSILVEWMRVATHPAVFPSPLSPNDAKAFVLGLVSDPAVEVLTETPRHAVFFARILAEAPPVRGNLYHDVHIAALALERGVDLIATADKHFRLFRFFRIVDPTAEVG